MTGLIKGAVKVVSYATLKPASAVILKLYWAIWARNSWVPIFYFFLPPLNTASTQIIHTLYKIHATTGRRVIAISAWPFTPASTAKDQFFTSFIELLTPNIRYIWIPHWLQSAAIGFINLVARSVGRHEDLYRAVNLDSPIRYTSASTLLQRDILVQGDRVKIHIPKSHEHVLESQLKEMGVPPDRWFVCVHAREHGYKKLIAENTPTPAGYQHEQEDHRNVEIEDYFPAMEYIASKGGVLIRMGDPSMKRLRCMDGVIDYPFTPYNGMPMDLYMVSKCRFIIGCNSGFGSTFPMAFNTPVLVTNFTSSANSARWPYSNNILLFKHFFGIESGMRLPLENMFHPSLSTLNDTLQLESLGYRWEPNTPEEILEATREMVSLVENGSFDVPMTNEQEFFHQRRIQALDALWSPLQRMGHNGYSKLRSSESRISAVFAARHFTAEGRQRIDIPL